MIVALPGLSSYLFLVNSNILIGRGIKNLVMVVRTCVTRFSKHMNINKWVGQFSMILLIFGYNS